MIMYVYTYVCSTYESTYVSVAPVWKNGFCRALEFKIIINQCMYKKYLESMPSQNHMQQSSSAKDRAFIGGKPFSMACIQPGI